MIQIDQANKKYTAGGETLNAVDNVTLAVQKSDVLSIVGHSGSGKSTLLSLIGGLTRPDSGKVSIDGTDLWSLPDKEQSYFRNKKINYIYQFASLFPTLSVIENIILPTTFGKWPENTVEKAHELLDLVGLSPKANSIPSQLSGGQQRRVAIARAFINDPLVVLADEPTGDLDEETESEIFSLFNKFNKEKQITFVIVTHSSELAALTTRQLRMTHGRLIENSTA